MSLNDGKHANTGPHTLHISLLGEFKLQLNGTAVLLKSPIYQALLAYLVLCPGQSYTRQHLAFTFWPDSSEKQARTNLRKALYVLRHTLPESADFLQIDVHSLAWRTDALYTLDVAEFETAVTQFEHTNQQYEYLKYALDLYRGDLLPAHYQDWIVTCRHGLRQQYLTALIQLIKLAETRQNYKEATDYANCLLQEDPLNEVAYRSLMRLQALNGNRAGALRTYQTCTAQLQRELGVSPSPATQEAYRRLLNLKPVPAARLPARLPLVGREESWATLQGWWQQAIRQQPLLAVLRGEAGIGKTRLAEELLDWAARQGITTLMAACFASGGNLPYAPITEWLRTEAMREPLTSLAEKWQREVSRVLPELLVARPDLSPPGPIAERWQQQHLFTALATAILSANQPLLLFIDNLQWCDPDTLTWLCFLLRYNAQARFMLLGTVRNKEFTDSNPLNGLCQDLRQDGRFVEIELNRLDETATTKLATFVTGQAPTTKQATQLFAETEGVPLFIVEMARAGLFETAHVQSAIGDEPDTSIQLPNKVRRVIKTRLANLSPAAREIAELAAAIGRYFTFDLLAAASGEPESRLVSALDELWHLQIIREHNAEGYDFSHDKLRQVAYASLSTTKQRWLHGRIASALETLQHNNLDSISSKLAAHYEAAGCIGQAIDYYQWAAKVARAVYANQETIQNLQRAIALLPQVNAGAQQEFELYKSLGEVFKQVARFEEAEKYLVEAIASTSDQWHLARLYRSLAGAQGMAGHYDDAFLSLQRAEEMLQKVPPVSLDRWWDAWLDNKFVRLNLYYFTNQTRELVHLGKEVGPILAQYSSPEKYVNYSRALTKCSFLQERYVLSEETLAHAETVYTAAKATGLVDLTANCLFDLALTNLWFGWEGNLTEAERLLAEVQDLAEQMGNRHLRARCLNYRMLIHRRRGERDEVSELAEQALSAANECHFKLYVTMIEGNLAWLHWKQGEVASAKLHADKAYAKCQSLPSTSSCHWAASWPLIAIAIMQDETAKAVEYARNLLDPWQLRLPEDVTAVLNSAIFAWENQQADSAFIYLQQAIDLAQNYNYL